MFHQTSIVRNDTALEAFKELSKKVEYDGDKFVGTDFFNEKETLEGLDDQKKYLIARSKVEVVDGSINRKYYLEHFPVQPSLHTEVTDIPLTKNELTMSEVTEDVIIVMKKTGVDSHKYPANVPALFSIKDSKDAVVNGKLAVMVDGELRAEFAKNSDNNYLGLVTYGHPGQLDNYTLGELDENKLNMTLRFHDGTDEWSHDKITLGDNFKNYFPLVEEYHKLRADGAMFRNDEGTITPLELTLQALTEFNYITLSMNGFTEFGFNVVSEIAPVEGQTLPYLSNTDENKGLSNILFQDLEGNTLTLEELSNNYTIYIKSYDFPTSGTNWTKYSAKQFHPVLGTVTFAGGWQNKEFPLPEALRPMRIYIEKNENSAKDLRICFNGQSVTKNEITFNKGFNDFTIPVSQDKKIFNEENEENSLMDNEYNERLIGDWIKLTDENGDMSWTKYSAKQFHPVFGTLVFAGGWQNNKLEAKVNNYSRYYRDNDDSVTISFNL